MTKDDLKKYTETKREIEIIEDKLEYLKEKKTSINSMIITDMPKGTFSDNDRFGQLLVQIEELTELYKKKMQNLLNEQIKIENVINELDDPLQRNIMRLRYLQGLSWEKICVEINYRWRQTHKYHSEALKKICD